MCDTLAKLTDVFQSVFDDDELTISRTTSPKDVDNWDSMAQVTLVVNVEKAFKIRFSSAEVAGLKDVGGLIDLIEARRAK